MSVVLPPPLPTSAAPPSQPLTARQAKADAKAAKATAKALRPWYRKKRFLAIVIVVIIVIVIASNLSKKTSSTTSSGPNPTVSGAAAPVAPEGSNSDFNVKIEGATFASDFEGKRVIVVNFAFTNNSDKAANFLFSLNAQAFQGGIELNDIAIGVDGIDSSLTTADIQPGVTVTVQQPFLLRDDSTVKVEVREQFSFSDDVLASQEFSVSK